MVISTAAKVRTLAAVDMTIWNLYARNLVRDGCRDIAKTILSTTAFTIQSMCERNGDDTLAQDVRVECRGMRVVKLGK
jgi:hypothetical protein